MIIYLKYFLTWLFFMAIICAVTLLVPRIAKYITNLREKYKTEETETKEDK